MQSPIDDTVTIASKSLILQPIIHTLEQLTIQSNSLYEPKIMSQIGLDFQSVPCQMALINICLKSVQAPNVYTIIAEEAFSSTSILHEIGTRVLIRCLAHTPINVILENARATTDEQTCVTSLINTASRALTIAKEHMEKKVSTTALIDRY